MTYNWAANLDMLAQNGVLDFDAPAYITGQPPRYVGSLNVTPSPYANPDFIPKTPYQRIPDTDEFVRDTSDKKDIVSNPSWKKWAFGLIAAATLIFGGYKLKSKILPWVQNKFKNFNFKSVKTYIADKSKQVGQFFKNGWNKFTGLFKSKKT